MNGKKVQDSDYESVRELANHCKKEGVNLGDLISKLESLHNICYSNIATSTGQTSNIIISINNYKESNRPIITKKTIRIDGI